jgi:hypothetical protein
MVKNDGAHGGKVSSKTVGKEGKAKRVTASFKNNQ